MLPGSVVISAAGDDGVDPMSVGGGLTKKVGRGLGSSVGGTGFEGSLLIGFFGRRNRAVDLVGGAVKERNLPALGNVQQQGGAEDIGGHKVIGLGDGAVDMGFGGQVENAGDLVFGADLCEDFRITNVTFDKMAARVLLGKSEIGAVAGVGQLIEDHETFEVLFLEKMASKAGANEAGPASEKY